MAGTEVLAMVEVEEVSCKCRDDIGREGDALQAQWLALRAVPHSG